VIETWIETRPSEGQSCKDGF